MSLRLAAVALIALAFAAAPLTAQQPATPKTSEERIAALEKEVEGLKKRIGDADVAKDDLDKRLSELAARVTKNGENLGMLTTLVGEQNGQISKLNADFNETKRLQTETQVRHEQILGDISRNDGGRYVPQISAAMAKESFRQEMGAAVHATLKSRGQFRIVNKTASHQSIAVNLIDYVLQPGEERILDVPVGTVTTQLPGEPLVNWTLAHKGEGVYAESIDIVPKTTVQRVIESPVYYRPTVYTETTLPIVTYRPY